MFNFYLSLLRCYIKDYYKKKELSLVYVMIVINQLE